MILISIEGHNSVYHPLSRPLTIKPSPKDKILPRKGVFAFFCSIVITITPLSENKSSPGDRPTNLEPKWSCLSVCCEVRCLDPFLVGGVDIVYSHLHSTQSRSITASPLSRIWPCSLVSRACAIPLCRSSGAVQRAVVKRSGYFLLSPISSCVLEHGSRMT